jgi:ADP-dependent NAD(P)H-hydrate dehydratase
MRLTPRTSEPPVSVTNEVLRDWPVPAPSGGGKESRGTVVVIGGAHPTPGAVALAGIGALRVGAGKLTVATVERNSPAPTPSSWARE